MQENEFIATLALDKNRINSLTKILSEFKRYDIYFVKNALMELKYPLIPSELCNKLLPFCPSPMEIKICENFKGNFEKLDIVHQYFLLMSPVPMLSVRLKIIIFKTEFPIKLRKSLESLKLMDQVCKQINNHEDSKMLLRIYLDFSKALCTVNSIKLKEQGTNPWNIHFPFLFDSENNNQVKNEEKLKNFLLQVKILKKEDF